MSHPASSFSTEPAFEGALEGFTREGYITGWARRLDGRGPAMVRLLLHGEEDATEIIGEAAAIHYRRRLLVDGKNWGHCAFFARPRRPLPPGLYHISLLALPEGVEIAGRTPLLWPEHPETELASRADEPATWTDADVLSHLDQFDLERHFEALGPERFADRAYSFILGRWMDDAGRGMYPPALKEGRLTPREFLDILLNSTERQAQKTPLPSPYHYRFPFR